jgi:hypothetical protein
VAVAVEQPGSAQGERHSCAVVDPRVSRRIRPLFVGPTTSPELLRLIVRIGMSSAAVAALPDISEADQAQMTARIEASPELRWQVIRRGFWVNDAADLSRYLAAIAPFRIDGRAMSIRCPVLGTAAHGIPWPPPPNRSSRHFPLRLACCPSELPKAPETTARCRTGG